MPAMSILEPSTLQNPPTPTDTSATAQTLRAELKAWESSFAAANGGRKAGRDDIKQAPEIAQKYKEYSKLRAHPEGPTQRSCSPVPQAKKRKRPSANTEHASTSQQRRPRSPIAHAPLAALDLHHLPASHLTPNPVRTIIGPTPQKNGLVLGLFDLLSPHRTPSKLDPATAAALPAKTGSFATPSKRKHHAPTTTPSKHTQTPLATRTRPSSASAASLLTPTARRTAHGTPSSSRAGVPQHQLDDTPEFLRRSAPLFPSLAATNAGASQALGGSGEMEMWSPVAMRLPRKPIGRGLSALVKGLRAMEEETLDEELDLLREMEEEEMGVVAGQGKTVGGGGNRGLVPKVLVEDSQQVEMPLGPDGEGDDSSEEDGEAKGRGGRPAKVWKKKGQKRSTRKVVMRPSVAKWKPEKEWACGVEAEAEEGKVVRETQTSNVKGGGVDEEEVGEAASGYEDIEDGAKNGGKAGGEKKKKKAPKKISATAHANFRALKIKNKQSKGKRGGKFGRRK